MRVIIPQEILDLMEMIKPYILHTEEKGCFLEENAPADVVIAKEKIINWMHANASRA